MSLNMRPKQVSFEMRIHWLTDRQLMQIEGSCCSQGLMNSGQLAFEKFYLGKKVFILGCTWLRWILMMEWSLKLFVTSIEQLLAMQYETTLYVRQTWIERRKMSGSRCSEHDVIVTLIECSQGLPACVRRRASPLPSWLLKSQHITFLCLCRAIWANAIAQGNYLVNCTLNSHNFYSCSVWVWSPASQLWKFWYR